MPEPLPAKLAYLVPALTALAQFEPEFLDDDNPAAIEIVETAVCGRIRGLPPDEAWKAVEDDCGTLEAWLHGHSSATSPAHFARGAMLGMLMFADFNELCGP